MMCFVQFSMDRHVPNFDIYRNAHQKTHGRPAPTPLLLDFCYCDTDAAKAEKVVRKYLATNYLSILQHDEFMQDYHKEIKGYEAYGEAATFLNSLVSYGGMPFDMVEKGMRLVSAEVMPELKSWRDSDVATAVTRSPSFHSKPPPDSGGDRRLLPMAATQPVDNIDTDLMAPDATADPSKYFAQLRAEHPVFWDKRYRSWIVTS